MADSPPGGPSELSKGYALLYELVSKQSGLGKALLMGGMGEESKSLVREIADSSKRAAETLKSFAQADSTLRLDQKGLPRAEEKSREAEESGMMGRLLFAGGNFELRLLLTQVAATGYGGQLARQVAGLDDRKDRRAWLADFAEQYETFRNRAEQRLTTRGKK